MPKSKKRTDNSWNSHMPKNQLLKDSPNLNHQMLTHDKLETDILQLGTHQITIIPHPQ